MAVLIASSGLLPDLIDLGQLLLVCELHLQDLLSSELGWDHLYGAIAGVASPPSEVSVDLLALHETILGQLHHLSLVGYLPLGLLKGVVGKSIAAA